MKTVIGILTIIVLILAAVVAVFIIERFIMEEKHTEYKNQADSKSLPGVGAYNKKLQRQIEKLAAQRGASYKPRTKHLKSDGTAKYTNRLFLESSPYLLQHANNPVNWFPWGDEAFALAKELNRPVIVSIGYSTCHWCHVMEEESFDDEEIAKYINENYIIIKVDREERPDIDSIYMQAVQAMTGRGGWPMNVWLTPDKKPFFGGTYFPARDGDRGSTPGFLSLLQKLKKAYDEQPEKVRDFGEKLSTAIQQQLSPTGGNSMPLAQGLHSAIEDYKQKFDATKGGLLGAPKFPSSLPIRFLLRYHYHTGDQQVLDMVTLSLNKMATGGMYDHIGGGFHRYSTDANWQIPHFEKMLYDNALLSMTYLEAYQVTGDEHYADVTRDILTYIQREMTSQNGGFYAASDADSLMPNGKKEEGYYFSWTPEELQETLGSAMATTAANYYNVTSHGNFEGRSVLHLNSLNAAPDNIVKIRNKLLNERQKRQPPQVDKKIITAWNGLMISAFAQAGLILDAPQYTQQAEQAANHILDQAYDKNILYRSMTDGNKSHPGFLSDYAFFIAGLLDLYEATSNIEWLNQAITLDNYLATHFEDTKSGGFYRTGDEQEMILTREKPSHGGAIPSGNAIAILNLLRLNEFTTNQAYRDRANLALTFFSDRLNNHPTAVSEMLYAVDFILDQPKEIIIVNPQSQKQNNNELAKLFRQQFIPNRIFVNVSEGDQLNEHARIVPLLKGKTAQQGKVTAYICIQGVCEQPTQDLAEFTRQLKKTTQWKVEAKNGRW